MGNSQPENMVSPVNQNSEIRKSKALLFAKTAPSNLPVPAQRLFLAMLANIDENTPDDKNVFIIRGKDIAELSDLKPNVVGQQLEEMALKADALRGYNLIIKEDDGNDLRVGLISSTKYLKGQRAIRVSVDQFLMPHLKKMRKQFDISYAISGPMKFRSEYSIRLFEMMSYYLADGYHYFTIPELRSIFNIPDGKIKHTYTLNQRIILPSIQDINTFTNLKVEVKYEKQGRTIVGYHFTVKDTAPRIEIEQNNQDEIFITMLISPPYNFNKATLINLISKYGIESVKNNFTYTKEHNPDNFSAYLNWAIKNAAYEKDKEIKQIEAVNKSLKNGMTPPPQYSKEVDLFAEQNKEESKPVDYDRLKSENPKLYELIMKVNNKIKE